MSELNDFHELRLAGVLQRIGLCYFFAALVVMNTRRAAKCSITAALLVGYWALLAFVAPPGGVAGDYSKLRNLAGYVDAPLAAGQDPRRILRLRR